MDYYGNKTLYAILEELGTDEKFSRFVVSMNKLAEIEKRKLDIVKQRKEVISRDLVRLHIFGAIETGNLRLLNDLPGNLTRFVYNQAESGERVEMVEGSVRDMISQVLEDVKVTAERGLRNA